jgi:hypothetical protein
MKKHIVLSIASVLLILPVAAVAGGPSLTPAGALSSLDGGFDMPAAWSGLWFQEIAIYDCTTELLIYSTTSTDTACTGDAVFTPEPGITIDCTGTTTDTNIDMECTWSIEEPAGCIVTNTLNVVGTRSSNSYQMNSTMQATHVGDTCEYVDAICIRSEITGTRIGPQPQTCGSPVEAATWGRVKALYR